ncbi:hypothetical protein ACA574_16700, partial [Lactiplantibacillus plantarum]
MAESNATQVILTDDGIKIINAQSTADNAANGVANLNNPNLMSVIEKQTAISQYAGLTSQYKVVLARAKDAYVSTTTLTTAYTNLSTLMTSMLTDTAKASDVDRDTYKGLIDAYNSALLNVQNALKDAYNTDINNMQSDVSVASQAASSAAIVASQAAITGDNASQAAAQASMAANQAQIAGNNATSVANNASQAASGAVIAGSQAASTASQAFSQAQSAVDYASSGIAVQYEATQKAQSAASDAVEQASSAAADSKDAKQIAGAVSQSYKTLTDGSTMTIAELQNGLATKLTKTDLNGYATQTWTQNQIKVTADGISGTMSGIKNTVDSHTTSINTLQADSNGFKAQFDTVNDTLSTQSTDIGTLQATSKSLTSGFNTLTTDNNTNKNNISQLKQTSTKLSSTMETVQTQVQNSAVGTNLLVGTSSSEQSHTSDFSTIPGWGWGIFPPGSQPAVNVGSTYTYSIYFTKLTGSFVLGFWAYDSDKKYVGWFSSGANSSLGKVSWTFKVPSGVSYIAPHVVHASDDFACTAKEEKLEKGSLATDWCPNPADIAAQSQITQLSHDINLRVTKGDLIDQINVQAGNTLISSSGQLTLSGKSVFLDSVNPVIMKSANIADLAVGNAQIANGAINQAKIANAAIGSAQIKDLAVTNAKIGNVSANKLTAGTIDFNTITGKNINASNITTGTMSTDRLNVGKLSALSANLGDVTAGSLKGVDIVAETFSTPNGSFTTDSNGAITAKNMTLTGGTLTSPTINASTINGSTINGGTLNMQTDGLINSPYTGIVQTADNFYHPWKLNTGQLTIGQGYITSVSSGTRSINGVPTQFNHVQGTLSASYLKFTNDYGNRIYIDADMITSTSSTNSGASVSIGAGGISISPGTSIAPA